MDKQNRRRVPIVCRHCSRTAVIRADKLKPTGNFCNTTCSNRFYGFGFKKGHPPYYLGYGVFSWVKSGKKEHSPETKAKLSAIMKAIGRRPPVKYGKDHPHWNGGGSVDKHTGYRYESWRKAVFERDDYRCFDCGKRGGKLHAHHWHAWARYKRLRLDVDNGITLCYPCHLLKHKRVYKVEASQTWSPQWHGGEYTEPKVPIKLKRNVPTGEPQEV